MTNPVLLKRLPKDTDRFISLPTFYKGMLGVSRMWWYRHRDDPGMPRPVQLGSRQVLLLSECEAYVRQQVANRAA